MASSSSSHIVKIDHHHVVSGSNNNLTNIFWGDKNKSRLDFSPWKRDSEDDSFSDDDLPDEYKKMIFFTMFQLLIFILHFIAFVYTFKIDITTLHIKLSAFLLLGWLVIQGRNFSGWGVGVLVFFVEKNFLLRKRILYFVYTLKNEIQNCFFSTLLLFAFQYLCYSSFIEITQSTVFYYINRVFICIVIGLFIWTLKIFIFKISAMWFHIVAYFTRIHESLFNRYLIERLTLNNEIEDSWITSEHLRRFNQKNISAWNMERMIKMVREDVFSNLVEPLESSAPITTEKYAKYVADKIFQSICKPVSGFIFKEDLMLLLREDEALNSMGLFAGVANKGISYHDLQNMVVNSLRERRVIALCLNNTNAILKELNKIVNVVVAVTLVVISLLILGAATLHVFTFIVSQLLLGVFFYGNTCKTTFEWFIFYFVLHPYDIGDRVEVEGEQMVVEEIHMMSTIFLTFDNQRSIYPNNVLATKPITNYRRSTHMRDTVEFCIHISTPEEKINKMEEMISSYVEAMSDHWYPAPRIFMKDLELGRIRWSVLVSHTINCQDMDKILVRRAALVSEIIKICRELDIEYII